ncbi:MAG: heme-copper oxidase subunit III [Candidatus Eremiobacteraeota bacterium]|nr:heme-copper oxidase subunit III [Candidatus Eremiobacteraeota bacterium]MBV8283132.1 heme-copper oxidase subunit III [Candidatus Eremiobacteraeota bacterium]MBV8333261.1 heme-copper oxidase subunit III [Candidatus Eremiobacteraeota bacterium]MBV8434448.1 heme-copper oxidase subunit III [Candidatus Eremiobacteraeota bacterium]MBV8655348.1 heme-copper oxidase subunit III [Candidatus Eremiobacteraeota bacterium]
MNGIANGSTRSVAPLPLRAHTLVLGVVLFLASELMFFAALFAAYYDLRANRIAWPPASVHLRPVEASAGTLLLFLASAVMMLATRAMDRRKFLAARRWTATAIVAALCFVAIAVHGYATDTFWISTNAYGSIYYAMTGFHLLHVIAGIGILAALAAGMRSPALQANHRAGAEAMTYYWHFVFVVWLGIWATIYFVR